MSRREIIAYAISHAPRGQKGGPYEGAGELGATAPTLALAYRYRDGAPAGLDAMWLRNNGHTARVIRIVRCPVADLKTTRERRDRFRAWLHDGTSDRLSPRAWCVAEDACHDVDTLLAENAKLREVAEAAREYRAMEAPGLTTCCDVARDALDAALAALEAP